MMGLKEPGLKVWLEPNDDPKRKLKFGWRLVEFENGHWSGIDTSVPNRVVKEALLARAIPELAAYGTIKPEQKYGTNSRIDFLAQEPGLPDTYVEVKNVHLLREADWAEFPDSVTTRGAKHLGELCQMVAEGHRAVMLYLVQRTDCTRFKLAPDLDPGYAAAFDDARARGVEMICYDTHVSTDGVTLRRALPIDPNTQSST